MPLPWDPERPKCDLCGAEAPPDTNSMYCLMAVGPMPDPTYGYRLCCPDCQRTVREMRGMDGMVNG